MPLRVPSNPSGLLWSYLRAAVAYVTRRYPGVFRTKYPDRKGRPKWTRTWSIRYTFRGETVRERTHTTDQETAWQLRLKRLQEIGQGRLILGADKVTSEKLEELVYNDLDARGKKTAESLSKWYRPVHEFFAGRPMLEVKPMDLTSYVKHRTKADKAAPGTVSVELAWFRRGFSLAVESDLLPRVPPFPRIEVNNARMVFADWPVVERLLPHLPAFLRPVILTAHFSGWRKESILNRERALHLDLDGRWLYLAREANKGKLPVRIWLNETLLEALRAQDEKAREIELRTGRLVPWLFFYPETGRNNEAGGRIVDFDHVWQEARRAAGMPGLHFHDLRRGAIRTLRRARNTEGEIMQWAGLKTPAVFRRYDIVDEDDIREVGKRQERYERRQQGKTAEFRRKP